MSVLCPHGMADPRRCEDCRRAHSGPGTEDPDIKAAWDDVRHGLAAMIRPYVQDHLIEGLARRAVAELLAGPGWRPPLKKPPDWLQEARVRSALLAADPAPSSTETETKES